MKLEKLITCFLKDGVKMNSTKLHTLCFLAYGFGLINDEPYKMFDGKFKIYNGNVYCQELGDILGDEKYIERKFETTEEELTDIEEEIVNKVNNIYATFYPYQLSHISLDIIMKYPHAQWLSDDMLKEIFESWE